MKNRKHKQRTDTLEPLIYPDQDSYEVKFNYFDGVRNVWVFGRKETVKTPCGKDRHKIASAEIKKQFPSAEIVSVRYC
jgi:hypothetical protein